MWYAAAVSASADSECMPYDRNNSAKPKPAHIRPIFSIDEYASKRFISTWTVEKTTPNKAVARPTPISNTPHHQMCVCSKSNDTRKIPYSAIFSMTPLINADTGEGAAGCASGSQACKGSTPALAPKPNTASTNAIDDQNGVKCCARMLAKV